MLHSANLIKMKWEIERKSLSLPQKLVICNQYFEIIQMSRILVVDDEQDLCEILQFNLSRQGHDVDVAYSAEEALSKLQSQGFDLLLLDVMMEGMSGFEMAERMKADEKLCAIPIIFCTAKDTESDTLRGFGLGADDYIAKPFRISEVVARVSAVLRRSAKSHLTILRDPLAWSLRNNIKENSAKKELTCQELRVDTTEKRVYIADNEITLTRKEYDILVLLMSTPGHIFSRDDILAKVWPDDVLVLDRSVDVSIARLRKKLGSEYARCIVSRSGYGYVFQA